MSDRLTIDEVAHVAKLARLSLTTDELRVAADQLGGMLEHFDDIDELDLTQIAPMTQPYHLVNVMREDVEADTLDRGEVLAAAPEADGGRFRVPSGGGVS